MSVALVGDDDVLVFHLKLLQVVLEHTSELASFKAQRLLHDVAHEGQSRVQTAVNRLQVREQGCEVCNVKNKNADFVKRRTLQE